MALHSNFARTADRAWSDHACAPLVESGPRLAGVRDHLANRAAMLGCPVSAVLEITLDAPGCVRAMAPAAVHTVRLVCAATRLGGDRRLLGALITGVRVAGAAVSLTDGRLARGFHDVEQHDATQVRWTDGAGIVGLGAAPDARLVEIDVAAVSAEPVEQRAA
jgi:hypothetical protein